MMKFKALVFIRLRSQVDDSPGNAVRDASKRLSELNIRKLRLGKVVDIWLEAETREYAEKELEMLSYQKVKRPEKSGQFSFSRDKLIIFLRGYKNQRSGIFDITFEESKVKSINIS